MHKIVLILALLCVWTGRASGQVALMPFTKSQFFNNSGQPCAGCKLFTYSAGTTTPIATYTNSLGVIPNTNPVVLDAAGRANVWLSPVAYKLILQTAGGVTLWSEDNITSANNTLLGLNNVWTGTNTWNNTATFNSSVNFNSGFTSTGPNILNGGGVFAGTYTGTSTFAGTVNFTGTLNLGTVNLSGQLISTLATGTPPFVIASTTKVANLNVDSLDGCDWAVPCPIGSTTPNTGSFTNLLANTRFTLGGGEPQISTQGTDNHLLTAGAMAGAVGLPLCKDANGGADTCGASGFSKIQVVTYCASGCTQTGTPCTTSNSSFDTCSNGISWPIAFADTNYSVTCSGVTPVDPSNPTTGRVNLQIASQNTIAVNVLTVTLGASAVHWTQINCLGIHP